MAEQREKWKLIASRPVGRQMDKVMKGIQTLKIVNWKRCAHDRNKWKSVVEQAKVFIFLCCTIGILQTCLITAMKWIAGASCG
jgi:hypothetical protein